MGAWTSGGDRIDVTMGLNYYAPYVSGLSEMARMLAEGLAARGMRVRVVTSRHDPSLPAREVRDGVEIERTDVVARVRNGVISPRLVPLLARRIRESRVGHLHLPMLEAGAVAMLKGRTPLLITYQCDYQTTEDLLGGTIRRAIDTSTRIAMHRSLRIAVTSDDYAAHSRVYSFMRGKIVAIAPPFVPRGGGEPRFRRGDGPVIGAMGRIVEEKGFDYLVRAFRQIHDSSARLIIAGDYEGIAGQSVIEHLRELARGDDRIEFLGFLPDEQVKDFFASIDVLAFPSVNPLEAFGIVQVEALSCGVPIVASDLPGVRLPVVQSGAGVLVPPRDVEALTGALLEVLAKGRPAVPDTLPAPDQAVDEYEQVLRALMSGSDRPARRR